MRTLLVCLFLQFVFMCVGLGQEKIDVIYLKNGDIRKGIIIENVPNEKVKIETSDGSIFTIQYADIQKITKETKAVSAAQLSSPQSISKGLMARTGDFGITAALWLGGKIRLEDYSVKTDKKPGILLKAFYDAYLMERFSIGAYASFAPVSVEFYNTSATVYEIGGAIKGRFPLNDGAMALKTGLNLGYRAISSDYYRVDKSDAFALNGSFELQFDAKNKFVPFIEVGFITQIVGGNDYTSITFPPIIYLGGGVAF